MQWPPDLCLHRETCREESKHSSYMRGSNYNRMLSGHSLPPLEPMAAEGVMLA